jgi:prepilin-type N-terminal cleavage/methylation domain-containing protein
MAQRGVTMIEVSVATAIGLLIVMVAIPAFNTTLERSRVESATRRVVSTVREARTRAVSTGWEYRVIGFGNASSSAARNQFRWMGRNSSATAWPDDNVAPFTGATQVAGPWIDVVSEYGGVDLDPSGSVASDRFEIAFDSRGAVSASSGNFAPFRVLNDDHAKGFRISAVGSVSLE